MGVNPDAFPAMLALPKDAPERQWRLLAALGTFKPDAYGWVSAGNDLVARTAGLHIDTVRKGRNELVAMALLKYEAGNGRGKLTRWLIVPPPRKGRNIATHLSEPGKGRKPPPERVGSGPVKGRKPNSLTRENANTAFTSSAHTITALSNEQRAERDIITLASKHLGRGISDEQARDLIDQLEPDGGYEAGSPVPYITRCMKQTPDRCHGIIDGDFVPGPESAYRSPRHTAPWPGLITPEVTPPW